MRITLCIILLTATLGFSSCKDDETVTCSTCSAPQTLDFELCEESDGNASVNGENTGTPYNIYLQDLQADGVNCGN